MNSVPDKNVREVIAQVIADNPYTEYSYVAQNAVVERDRAIRHAHMIALTVASRLAAPSAIEPKLKPAVLPALPGQKPLTFLMQPPEDMKQADAVIEALKRGDTTFVPTPISELFFHQLRLRVAQDPTLADKIAVYYLHEGKWREVGLRYGDSLRWPVGFCQEGWEIEGGISKARSASTDGGGAPTMSQFASKADYEAAKK